MVKRPMQTKQFWLKCDPDGIIGMLTTEEQQVRVLCDTHSGQDHLQFVLNEAPSKQCWQPHFLFESCGSWFSFHFYLKHRLISPTQGRRITDPSNHQHLLPMKP